MGIRIHKAMGYGIKDLLKDDPRLVPGWNKDALVPTRTAQVKDLVDWARKNFDTLLPLTAREYPSRTVESCREPLEFDIKLLGSGTTKKNGTLPPWDCIIRKTGDFNRARTLLFIPPECGHWYRFDDTIDYYESGPGMKTRTVTPKAMTTGIYPWNHAMIRVRPPRQSVWRPDYTPKPGEGDALGPTHLEGGWWKQLIGTWDPKIAPYAKGAALKHYKQDFRPRIPTSVIALICWSGIAKDPAAFIDELRPMIFSYWD